MDQRKILLYLALKYEGDWDKIFAVISNHEEYDEKEANELIEKVNSPYLTYLDKDYPEFLKQSFKPPFVLFYHGDISLLQDNKQKIGVVGSRKASEYGFAMTEKLVKGISKDFVIVSGLAVGIDACAHKAAIESGGKTIAVLGNGVNFHYIKENMDLYEEIKKNHLVISEYPDMTPANSNYFPIRNRIIAGLCHNLLIPEGRIRSGTQITATLVASKSGNVCCVPARAGEDSICNSLIKEGAYLVETPEDIYDATSTLLKKPIFDL
jgi:DNA processing protein